MGDGHYFTEGDTVEKMKRGELVKGGERGEKG